MLNSYNFFFLLNISCKRMKLLNFGQNLIILKIHSGLRVVVFWFVFPSGNISDDLELRKRITWQDINGIYYRNKVLEIHV